MSTRRARPSDIDEICGALPDVELGTSWGDVPTWKVPRGAKGKGFVMYRRPHKSASDPITGELYDDLVVILTTTEAEKTALVEDPTTPFFTVPHFDGYDAVLVRQSQIGQISRDELAEIITEAWLKRAPKRLARTFLDSDSDSDSDSSAGRG